MNGMKNELENQKHIKFIKGVKDMMDIDIDRIIWTWDNEKYDIQNLGIT